MVDSDFSAVSQSLGLSVSIPKIKKAPDRSRAHASQMQFAPSSLIPCPLVCLSLVCLSVCLFVCSYYFFRFSIRICVICSLNPPSFAKFSLTRSKYLCISVNPCLISTIAIFAIVSSLRLSASDVK